MKSRADKILAGLSLEDRKVILNLKEIHDAWHAGFQKGWRDSHKLLIRHIRDQLRK